MCIVTGVDGSERDQRILEQAMTLATALNKDLYLVHVLSRNRFVELERTSVNQTGEAVDIERVREIASEIATEAGKDVSQPFQAVGLFGDVATRITEYADEIDASYVVIGGRKRSPVGKALFGNVTQDVLLSADCPVVMVPE